MVQHWLCPEDGMQLRSLRNKSNLIFNSISSGINNNFTWQMTKIEQIAIRTFIFARLK